MKIDREQMKELLESNPQVMKFLSDYVNDRLGSGWYYILFSPESGTLRIQSNSFPMYADSEYEGSGLFKIIWEAHVKHGWNRLSRPDSLFYKWKKCSWDEACYIALPGKIPKWSDFKIATEVIRTIPQWADLDFPDTVIRLAQEHGAKKLDFDEEGFHAAIKFILKKGGYFFRLGDVAENVIPDDIDFILDRMKVDGLI